MSYKVEHFSGNWYDEGYVFGTLEEAKEYSLHRAIIPSRVVEATQESSMQSGVLANSPVNYTFKDGKLSPHKALLKSIVTWEDFVMAGGGCGTPFVNAALNEAAIEAMLKGLSAYKFTCDQQIRVIKSSEMMLPVTSRPLCEGCGNEIDPDCCWCGDTMSIHGYASGHHPVSMGCDCFRAMQQK